jgi:hypothetical protein
VPGSALQEDYAEGQGGKRVVQYFDKSRMEINNPQADPNSPFFVTNGLLTVELISGKVQTGNNTYTDRFPAAIPLASDNDDPDAPTYASFVGVANTPLGDRPAASAVGQPAILVINKAGTVSEDPTKSSYPGTRIAHFEATTKHNIPEAIWLFLNESGPVSTSTGVTQTARLSDPWFYATGLPISEAYWANVKIAGQKQDVLIQAFERRVVTYAPNGVPGFKVQMGNIGQHYYDWRYKDTGRPPGGPTPPAAATPTRPAAGATATPAPPTPAPNPNADCSGIPAQNNMVVTPNCGPGGTFFRFLGSGFDVNELVGVYVTDPTQAVYGAPFQAQPDAQGRVGVTFQSGPTFPAGVWAMTMEGVTSKRVAIGYFKITAAAPTPTRVAGGPPPSCDTSGSRNGEARPNSGTDGDVIMITARGFQRDEPVSFWFTFPDGDVIGTEAGVEGLVNADGSIGPLPIEIDSFLTDYPGTWAITFQGDRSGNLAVIFFCVYR